MSTQLEQALEEARRLEALIQTELIDSPSEAAFDRLTELASKVLNAPVSLVSLIEPDRQFFKSQIGLPEPWSNLRETPLSHSFCQHVVASGEPLIIEDARNHPLVRDNLAIRDLNVVSYLGIPLTSPEGLNLGSFCVIDHQPRVWTEMEINTMKALAASVITEIKLLLEAKAREAALAELHALTQELDAFAHTVSHNLKNPISGIIGWVSICTQYSDRMSKEELLDAIDNIGQMATQTNEIIQSLMLLAGVHRAGDVPHQKLNMHHIIDDALSRLKHIIDENEVKINLPAPEAFPPCIGYRPWLEEVWINYISNAIKYGGQPPIITFGAEQSDEGLVRYWITDNGTGISSDDQDLLFIPFSRLPQTAQSEGHGLGLSIVQSIIEKLDGTVGVESELGVGSTFSFTLQAPTN